MLKIKKHEFAKIAFTLPMDKPTVMEIDGKRVKVIPLSERIIVKK